jgi:hypothetical protein
MDPHPGEAWVERLGHQNLKSYFLYGPIVVKKLQTKNDITIICQYI